MTPDQIDLARRLVACPRWRWMPGMRSVAYRQAPLDPVVNRIGDLKLRPYPGSLPDLSDPATAGCLLALVREAWGDPEAHLALGAAGWVLMSGESRVADVVYPSPAGTTEAEALVVALEAAP